MDDVQLQRTLGEVARDARKRLGLTQAQVARQVGLTPEVYGRIERGGRMPSIVSFWRICLALGISADALLDLERTGVASSKESAPEAHPSPALRHLMRLVRGWPPEKVELFARVARLIGSARQQ